MPVGMPEFVENPSSRCPVVLLLDTSGSMSGQPIEQLNRGLSAFLEDVQKDEQASLSVELALVKFGGSPQLINNFQTVDELQAPYLSAEGLTPMGEAINYALDLLETRKSNYKENGVQYYRPWVFLITDGAPNNDSPWQMAADRVKQAETEKRLLFFTVAVEGANMEILKQIAPSNRPPVWLNGLDFRSMFLWLSASMKQVSGQKVGEAVELPPVSGWAQIDT
ncbi:VWA domain-containing protein [Euhalothece natronophila Z-M001]|uniref:VWA domain-containing protein n=1 Tax=Euhalothece natronophila Z-M001 TaxID=522448 RepID=A0A5B8NNN7_9CHRO|nr:VWA domain-containing protein [Euhalothece natronophila]QDZ40872.1 VWA domain-containing protein [Euhalothece natronophila Z-M001]